jgi:hypothetical protein
MVEMMTNKVRSNIKFNRSLMIANQIQAHGSNPPSMLTVALSERQAHRARTTPVDFDTLQPGMVAALLAQANAIV